MTGDDLKKLRKAAGLTQAEMAEAMGLTLRPYAGIERQAGEALRRMHEIAVERASLRLAIDNKNLDLALPAIRREALEYAALFRG